MNIPLQEMKMWPKEVNPLRLTGRWEDAVVRSFFFLLNACVHAFVWVIVGGHFLRVSEHALIGCHGEIRLNANRVAVSNPI